MFGDAREHDIVRPNELGEYEVIVAEGISAVAFRAILVCVCCRFLLPAVFYVSKMKFTCNV